MFSKAVSAVDPAQRLKEMIHIEKDRLLIKTDENSGKIFRPDAFKRIYLIGAGKASASMAQAIEEIFGDRMARGVIATKYGHVLPLQRTEMIEAGHPIPDQKGYEGAKKIQNLLSGTDGTDGPTDASGAVADHTTVSRARSMGLDPKAYLENNDASPFFQRLGDLLITGPTHTNVMDIRILLVD